MVPVSAIVPATNAPATLSRCTRAIRLAADPPEEVIVVDRPAGLGPAEARNAGAQRAAGEVIVFVDADVVVHSDAFTRIRAAFDRDPGLVAVFGSYDDSPAAPGVVSTFRNLLHHHVHQASAGPATTFWAGLGAVRRRSFEAAGGFDAERFRVPSVEDIDLGMRLAAAGARLVLDPHLQGKHLKAWTLKEMVRTDFADRGVPWVRLHLRAQTSSTALNLGWQHRLSATVCVAGIAAVARRRPGRLAAALLALVALNRSFYVFLVRRQGPLKAAAGVGLHALHHLTGAAALPVGVLAHLLDRARHRRCPPEDAPPPERAAAP